MGNIWSHFSPEFVISCSLFPFNERGMSVYEFSLPASLRTPFRLGVLVYGAIIIWASLRPSTTSGDIPHFDKLMHLLVYGFLAYGISLAWPKLSKVKLLLGCIVLGGGLEIAQGMMGSGRTTSLFDGLANSFGTVLGMLAATVIAARFNK